MVSVAWAFVTRHEQSTFAVVGTPQRNFERGNALDLNDEALDTCVWRGSMTGMDAPPDKDVSIGACQQDRDII